MNFCLSLLKYKLIAAVKTKVDNTMMSTLQYVYAYLYASWFLFIFKVTVMPISDCINVYYWGFLLINSNRNRNLPRCVNISKSAIAHTQIYKAKIHTQSQNLKLKTHFV